MSADDRVTVSLDPANQVVIHRHGATVVSWLCNGCEMLFVSSQAVFDNKKAIRGGIPVVFPNFGPWELGPQHGFARISAWTLHSQGEGNAVFTLSNNAQTEAMWPHRFQLTYTVSLSPDHALTCQLSVTNTGDQPFDFTTLLHTYIRVSNVTTTRISNLKGLQYIDKLRNGEEFTESEDLVSVAGGADRVYGKTPNSHEVEDNSTGLKVLVTKNNLPDTVVWNPWVENAKKMADFGDEEYKNMVCVEPGSVAQRIVLSPGETRDFSQTLKALSFQK